MPFLERQGLYDQIEARRGRPLLVYVTSIRPNASGQMAADAVSEIIRRMEGIEPQSDKGIDLLIVSNGGDPIVAWRIATLLRERYGTYHALVPYTAYSAATLLALGADTIVMHPYANLGPVDPQITAQRADGAGGLEVNQFPYADLTHYLTFVRENVGITDQRELQRSFELLCNSVTAQGVGAAKRSSQLMLTLGEKLLSLRKGIDRAEARTIAEMLNKSFYHHGYSLGRPEARELRLATDENDKELEKLIWAVWQSLSDEMECEAPFNPGYELYADPEAAKALDNITTVSLPADLPPALQQQVYGQILQSLQMQQVVSVPATIEFAVVESSQGRSALLHRLDIRGVRMPDMNITINVTARSAYWEHEDHTPGEGAS